MGGKLAGKTASTTTDVSAFIGTLAAEHRPMVRTLRSLILEAAPDATPSVKWGTLAYDLDGSLFAVSAPKDVVNLYVLTIGVLAKHKKQLAGISQGKCVLRFPPGAELPMTALRAVLAAAVATKAR